MFIEFKDEGNQSYQEGMNKPFLKKDEPFDVLPREGARLIKTGIFKEVSTKEAAALKKEKVNKLAKLPTAKIVVEADKAGVEVSPNVENRKVMAEKIVAETSKPEGEK